MSMCLFPILPQFHVPLYVKKKKMDNFMCLLEFGCAKGLKTHSQAIPEMSDVSLSHLPYTANSRSNMYLPWNQTLDDNVGVKSYKKKWRKATIWSRVCYDAAQCLLGESRLSMHQSIGNSCTSCPYIWYINMTTFCLTNQRGFLLEFSRNDMPYLEFVYHVTAN